MTRRARLFAGLCLALAAAFVALGVWQVERRRWKLALIAQVEARLAAPPQRLPYRWPAVGPADAYRRLRATGTFLHDRETLVQAVTDRGGGFWVLTPLVTAAGPLLVNRGFVPPERVAAVTRATGQPTGPVTVTGLLRLDEPGGGFLRHNDPAANRWFSRDVGTIAAARGLVGAAPFFVDADATPNLGGWPLGGLTVVRFRNTHLVYAITWFTLAGLAVGGTTVLLKGGR